MSDDKKYSAKEAAVAVLKKAEEMLKKSALSKAEINMDSNGKAPKGEIHPKEHVEGEAAAPKEQVEHQAAPEDNSKEQKEGNNDEWGTQPLSYGSLKLAHFMGHISAKRKARKIQI